VADQLNNTLQALGSLTIRRHHRRDAFSEDFPFTVGVSAAPTTKSHTQRDWHTLLASH
jgi:hypothetical protein